MIWLALTLPGLIVAYFLFLRPVLHAIPALKTFYDEADGFWAKVWAICGKSVTIAFSAFVQAVGWALQWIDPLASMLGDPDLKAQITSTLQANPQLLGYVLMGISAITIAARLRSIAKAA
ncbi:hypothetical protein [Bradyrhizobium sp. USDA 3458]|uniref:hypothetical protein n=1 Tax=Bradyrhizobium sp. USDA 3458 TaxID=2591461 RepID=UPI001141E07E|nr:hypothetical protein [Bradyrhizobium sp. USDA 3458]